MRWTYNALRSGIALVLMLWVTPLRAIDHRVTDRTSLVQINRAMGTERVTDTTLLSLNRAINSGEMVMIVTDTSLVQVNRALEVRSDGR